MDREAEHGDAGRPMTPQALLGRLRTAEDRVQGHGGREPCTVQKISRPPSSFELPGLGTDLLICHLAGPLFAEARDPGGRAERRWISPGQVGVTPSGQPIHRSFKGRPDVVLVHLDPDRVRTIAEEMFGCDPARVHLVPKLAEPDETARSLIRLLLAESERPMAGADLAVGSLASALSVHVLRHHSNLSAPAPVPPAGLSPGRLRRVDEFMRAHLDEPVSLGRLAAVAGLSPSRFGRAFRDATGEPPHRRLICLRVERACELLARTELPLVEIAMQCGFGEAGHFSTSFRKARGVTPRDWRRLHRA